LLRDSGCRSSFEWLYRLYDVAEATKAIRGAVPADIRFRRLQPADWSVFGELARDCGADETIPWMGLCAARFPVTAAGAFCDGRLLAASLYDIDSRGTIGPLLVSAAAPPKLPAAMLAEALLVMQQHGYQYAVEFEVPMVPAKSVAALAGTERRKPEPETPAEQLDLDLPFADLFVWLDHCLVTEIPLEYEGANIDVRVPASSERDLIVDWIRREFGRGWASEMDKTFSNNPISSVIAVTREDTSPPEQRLLAFCCYDSAGLGLSSTIAVQPSAEAWKAAGGWKARAAVVGLIIQGMIREMSAVGYRYCIGTGISKRLIFLQFTRGFGWTIPGSHPGLYRKVISYK
jgi:hypothetical protein